METVSSSACVHVSVRKVDIFEYALKQYFSVDCAYTAAWLDK